ncbi:hypothetical protein PRIPAC_70624 [Pristionchus pacificus]|uniref:Uncharacterized protein n=1 Tax=Pristionchus pacificus TaxID=54126 RepID=A0A2A6B4S4_PRIPA|nr:hypothetical protein PRIPAC_70624 [Pristionchus pacificus]|eukprot:PDM60880.1 hypothetical protein PRIPAC_54686 [Pristionchus pacificus]
MSTSHWLQMASRRKQIFEIFSATRRDKIRRLWLPGKSRKSVFDVTPSGANGTPTLKMKKPLVISTLENPKSHSFRESSFGPDSESPVRSMIVSPLAIYPAKSSFSTSSGVNEYAI